MKIVLYENDQVINVYEDITTPKKKDNKVEWDLGALEFSVPFILVNDIVEIKPGDPITADFIQANEAVVDITETEMLKKQIEDLKKENKAISKDFQDFMDFFFSQ